MLIHQSHKYRVYDAPHEEVVFSERESEILIILLEGSNVQEAAKVLALSPLSLEFHIKNMLIKLDCDDLADLLMKLAVSDMIYRLEE